MDDDMEASLFIDTNALGGRPAVRRAIHRGREDGRAMQPSARAHARIVTLIQTYDAAQLEDMRREDGGEI
jgi:hypothetical protein